MNSCLYECDVMHHRLHPKVNSFRYRIFMFFLDLDETICSPLFGTGPFKFYRFREGDHMQVEGTAGNGAGLKSRVIEYLHSQGIGFPADGTILLLTLPRVLGYIFNPVSFYFCLDPAGAPLCAIAEVGNTFRETKLFLLPTPDKEGRFHLIAPKHFYVSPFSRLDLEFEFKVRLPAGRLDIQINDREEGRLILLSSLKGNRAPLSAASLAWFTFKYPLITLKVIGLIHWQALLLWLKGLPFHRKAADPQLQRNVINAHSVTR